MQPQIALLQVEHKHIAHELEEIEALFFGGEEGYLRKTLQKFRKLEASAIYEHHKNEDEILFTWLLSRTKRPDVSVIDHFRKEHDKLESLHKTILRNLEKCLTEGGSMLLSSINFDIRDFIDCYREHMHKEEKFLFLIGDGLMEKDKTKAAG